jgi:hypothetical protein
LEIPMSYRWEDFERDAAERRPNAWWRFMLVLAVPVTVLLALDQMFACNASTPVERITIGLTRDRADAILGASVVQPGNVHWGGSGAYRRYYQLDAARQFWVEIGGTYHGRLLGCVIQVGPVEPLGKWTRHPNGDITVDPMVP